MEEKDILESNSLESYDLLIQYMVKVQALENILLEAKIVTPEQLESQYTKITGEILEVINK